MKTNVSAAEVAFLKYAIGAYRPDGEFYQRKLPADPILDAVSEDFVRVDFGSSSAVAEEYVAWLNSVYDATVQQLGFSLY